MQNEGRRILHAPDLRVNCTCVRVPVRRSHSIALTLRTEEKVPIEDAKAAVAAFPGVRLIEDYEGRCYPTPLDTTDQDLVWVGRIRQDLIDGSSASSTKTPDFQNPCLPGRGFSSPGFSSSHLPSCHPPPNMLCSSRFSLYLNFELFTFHFELSSPVFQLYSGGLP